MLSSLRKLVQSTKVQATKRTGHGHARSLSSRAGEACSDVVDDGSQTLQVDLGNTISPKATDIPPKFHFTAAEARQMMTELKLKSIRELLKTLLRPISTLARSPISQFHVGAVGMTPSGDIYVGVNMEFVDMPLNNSIHAEQFLVANLRHHRETELSVVAVNAAPCGHCRQFFSELQCSDRVEFVFGDPVRSYKLNQLLPMRFKPQDLLGDDPPPLLLSPQNIPLQYPPDVKESIKQRTIESPLFSKAAQLALQEARESYCPYSNCPAGVALITDDGKVYGGGYMESCAYNPSMQALQTALTHAAMSGMGKYTQIQEVVLAELSDMSVQHAAAARLLLSSIAPSAPVTELRLIKVTSASA